MQKGPVAGCTFRARKRPLWDLNPGSRNPLYAEPRHPAVSRETAKLFTVGMATICRTRTVTLDLLSSPPLLQMGDTESQWSEPTCPRPHTKEVAGQRDHVPEATP